MVRLKKLFISGFRSFAGSNTIEFSENGLTCLRGFNQDTGGSSGSGKSNLIYAITYALGYCPYPNTVLQSNYSSDPLQVDLTLDTDEGEVTIRRGNINCVKTPTKKVTSAKAIAEKIKEIIGLPMDFLAALTFHQQQERGAFLSMGDSDKKEFLAQLLGLEELEEQIEASNKTIKACESEIGKLSASLEVLKKVLVVPEQPQLLTDELAGDVVRSLEDEIKQSQKLVKGWADLLHKYSDEYHINKEKLLTDQALEAEQLKEQHDKIRANRLKLAKEIADKLGFDWKTEEEKELEAVCSSAFDRLEAVDLAIQQAREAHTEAINKLNADYLEQLKISETLGSLEAEARNLHAKIQAAANQKCPTCEQDWAWSGGKEADWRNEAQGLVGKIAKAKDAAIEAAKISQKIDQLHAEFKEAEALKLQAYDNLDGIYNNSKDQLQKCVNERRSKLEQWDNETKIQELQLQSEIANLGQKHANQLHELEKKLQLDSVQAEHEYNQESAKLNQLEKSLIKAASDVRSVKESNDAESRRYSISLGQYQDALTQVAGLDNDLAVYQAKLEAETTFVSALKGFLGAIFDEVLVEISNETNDLLKLVPNVATTTIQFTSEKVTQKGIVKPEIRPIIVKNGNSVPLRAGLSGGQFTSVDLAVDLAVGIVISRRTNKTPGWLILDESFEGHDVPVKEACLQMLKKAANNRLIIIVDHASEVKEMFDNYITVESKNDMSWIRS